MFFGVATQNDASRSAMKVGFCHGSVDSLKLLPIGAGCEHIATALCHPGENLGNLRWRLAGRSPGWALYGPTQKTVVAIFLGQPVARHFAPIRTRIERSHLYKKCQQLGIDLRATRDATQS